MLVVKTIKEVREQVKAWRKQGLTIGLVPTMGFLHEGHKSLMLKAASENDRVIVTDFVNPTQFGPTEDLASYPRDLARDTAICEEAGVALLFHPEVSEMYAENASTYVNSDQLTHVLCGKSRPVHFQGVCSVVSKLFNITTPDKAYFGEKDAQQLAVIKRMVRDLNFDITIVGCPIIREEDGLAMSSRNTYLDEETREQALILNKALSQAKQKILEGAENASALKREMIEMIKTKPLAEIDYVEIVDFNTLESVEKISRPVLAAVAVKFKNTRLIDNFILN